jgi:hypothetical protein
MSSIFLASNLKIVITNWVALEFQKGDITNWVALLSRAGSKQQQRDYAGVMFFFCYIWKNEIGGFFSRRRVPFCRYFD